MAANIITPSEPSKMNVHFVQVERGLNMNLEMKQVGPYRFETEIPGKYFFNEEEDLVYQYNIEAPMDSTIFYCPGASKYDVMPVRYSCGYLKNDESKNYLFLFEAGRDFGIKFNWLPSFEMKNHLKDCFRNYRQPGPRSKSSSIHWLMWTMRINMVN
jgi:hypothetical protein